MPPGFKGPAVFLPGEPQADTASVAKLQQVVERYQKFAGPLCPSPMAGKLTRDEWTRLHLVHAAHHLSFLRPRP